MATRKLRVVATQVITSGEGAKGPWTLRGVTATDPESGAHIDAKLKTFANLPTNGEIVEVEVEEQNHPQHGKSYLLKLPKGGSPTSKGLGRAVDELRDRVKALEAQVEVLLQRTSGGATARSESPPSGPPPAAPPADDDIPF